MADSIQLQDRTSEYALRVIRVVESLPATRIASVLGHQLLRCGTSVGANYRSACRARSPAEFCAKMGIVEEELDESLYWIDLLVDANLIKRNRLSPLMQEGKQLLAMTVASIKTARNRKPASRTTRPS